MRSRAVGWVSLSVGVVLSACGTNAGPGDAAANDGGMTPDVAASDGARDDSGASMDATPDRSPPNDAGDVATTDAATADAGTPDPYADGVYGVPTLTFTIPASVVSAQQEIYLPDVQTRFPDVDWANLDRLYIPAGHYSLLNLGNLPMRTRAHPLVITNLGGQVRIGGLPSSYLVSLHGGSGWVLTGRYDAISRTGDAAVPGHKNADYAHSRGRYGIVIDDEFMAFPAQERSGIGIDQGSSQIDLEYIEITGAMFAGVIAKTHNDPTKPMDGMRFHDLYIHDVGSEGFYIGDTNADAAQHLVTHLELYNNRVLRVGSETVQTGQLGDGAHIHNNVFALGGRMARDAFECGVQDGNGQYQQRTGVGTVDHNLFVGATQSLLQNFPLNIAGDAHNPGDGVTFADNYFGGSGWLGVYLHVSATPLPNTSQTFARNFFGDYAFTYDSVYPNLTARPYAISGSDTPNMPTFFTDNVYDPAYMLEVWGGDNGTFGMINAAGNTQAPVARPVFRDFGLPADVDYRRVEFWVPQAQCENQWASGQPDPSAPPPTYTRGAYVMWHEMIYRLDADTSTGDQPDMHPEKWTSLGLPADDVRLADGSPYAGMGLAY